MNNSLEVLIPLKQRVSINKTILSLLEIKEISLITILSGDIKSNIDDKIKNNSKLRIINYSQYPFSKTTYLIMVSKIVSVTSCLCPMPI